MGGGGEVRRWREGEQEGRESGWWAWREGKRQSKVRRQELYRGGILSVILMFNR